MDSTTRPLEALLTSDEGIYEATMSTETLPNPNPIVWISFTGGPNESAASFIQSIQRVAFQQNRIKDDEWIAELASTCFADKALVWYLGLGRETRSSWAKLRVALVRHYLVQIPTQPQQPSPARTPLQPRPQPKPASPAATDVGWIEVLRPQFGDLLGFMSQDSTGTFVVDPSPENAVKLQKVLHTDSTHQQLRIYSLKFVDATDPQFPFLGLKLAKFPGEDPNVVPQYAFPQSNQGYNHGYYGYGRQYNTIIQYRRVATCCAYKQSVPDESQQQTSSYAAWDFVQSTESEPGPYFIRKSEGPDPKTRVISAVWTSTDTVDEVAELRLTWPVGDKRNAGAASISEIQLDAILHKGKVTGLHVHHPDFLTGIDSPEESHVVLVFRQISEPQGPV